MSPHLTSVVSVAAIRPNVAVTTGRLGGIGVEIMLDSGSSVSFIRNELLQETEGIVRIRPDTSPLRLVTASGEELPIFNHIRARIHLGELEFMHDFVVVNCLVSPVILEVNFLHANGLVLDFTKTPVEVTQSCQRHSSHLQIFLPPQVFAIHEAVQRMMVKVCGVAATEAPKSDVIDEYAVPLFHKSPAIELPECQKVDFMDVVQEH